MKKAKLKRIEKVVQKVLEEETLAREDDCYLILQVVSYLYPFEVSKTFTQVMLRS